MSLQLSDFLTFPLNDTIPQYGNMKRLFYLLIVIGVAVVGFALGRATGLSGGGDDTLAVNHEYPLPPAPPESTPYFTEPTGEEGAAIVLESPIEGAKIAGQFEVSGRARADMGKVSVTLTGPNGGPLFGRLVSVTADAGAEYGRFSVKIGALDQLGDVILEVGFATEEEGQERVVRELVLVSEDLVEIEVFFMNDNLDLWQTCEKAFPVKREVSSEANVYRAAIEALLEGPTDDEQGQGYSSVIPDGVKLKSVAADAEGTVTADFNANLDRGVAGSCRVSSIRTQIESTLKQFPEVRGVVISVEGDSEEALQP